MEQLNRVDSLELQPPQEPLALLEAAQLELELNMVVATTRPTEAQGTIDIILSLFCLNNHNQ